MCAFDHLIPILWTVSIICFYLDGACQLAIQNKDWFFIHFNQQMIIKIFSGKPDVQD